LDNEKSTALITGASSGIGLELARLFARDGYNLVLLARSSDGLTAVSAELKKHSDIRITCLAKDLSSPNAANEIFQALKEENIEIDVLINNAGFGWYGEFSKVDSSILLEMIQVNISSLTRLTGLFLAEMVHKNKGRIMNVASTAAFQPGPLMAVYYATKAYVLSFSLALSEELRSTDIKVTALCPGPTPTNFGKRAGIKKNVRWSGLLSTDAKDVAAAGYKGLMKGKDLVIPGKLNWLMTQLIRVLPRTFPGKIIKLAQLQRGD
jgi:short-subunit dehydrogenase